MIEFKYTQSFNEKAVQQALGYDFFYQQAKQLTNKELQTVLLSAKTPKAEVLEQLGYFKTPFAGVYRSKTPIVEKVLLLSLNDLSNEPHNAWIKCFASKKKVKKETLEQLKTSDLIFHTNELKYLISGLREIWLVLLNEGETEMNMNLTPEDVIEFGKELGDVWLAGLTPSERLAGLTPSGLKASELLVDSKPKEIEEIEEYLKHLKKREH